MIVCGISGSVDANAERAMDRVHGVNAMQGHRGPDHRVVHRAGVFTLGNTRLAIQDPGPDGNQPFISADGRYHCVFNGEIYNYRLLVERYQLRVRTNCDGEIIPALWAKLGPASLAELRGMFAIALIDSLEGYLFLARDVFGIKPLYWRVLPDRALLFASELRPLVKMAAGSSLDPEVVARYLHFGAVGADQSPFREIVCLPPNSFAQIGSKGDIEVRPIKQNGPLVAADAPPDLGLALSDSIQLHLSADVPTVLLLSAGVDSAAIAAVGRDLGRDLHCVTVATEGSADESSGAAATARHYGHSFERIQATLDDRDVACFFDAMQRPSIDGLNTYLVSKAVKSAGYKVALSGIGGDEVVGGYSHFQSLRYLPLLRYLDAMPSFLMRPGAELLARRRGANSSKAMRLLSRGGPRDGWGISALQREVLPASIAARLTGTDCADDTSNPLSRGRPEASGAFGLMVGAELALYLQAMLLPDADAFSMTSSVELRVPFVDSHVFAASLGLAARTGGRPGKAAIGTALNDYYLKDLARHRKTGFSVPMHRWLSGPLAPVLTRAEEPSAAVWSVLDRAAAARAGLLSGQVGPRWAERWIIAALDAWLSSIHSAQVACPAA